MGANSSGCGIFAGKVRIERGKVRVWGAEQAKHQAVLVKYDGKVMMKAEKYHRQWL